MPLPGRPRRIRSPVLSTWSTGVKGCREIDACGGQQGEGEGEVCVEVSAMGALHQAMCTCTKESAAHPTTIVDVLLDLRACVISDFACALPLKIHHCRPSRHLESRAIGRDPTRTTIAHRPSARQTASDHHWKRPVLENRSDPAS